MKFILGKKIEMTQIFNEDGKVIPVTSVTVGPCVITQIRKEDKDGYTAVQVGYGSRNKIKKSLKGHFKDLGSFSKLKEFRVSPEEIEGLTVGQQIDASTFEKGEKVTLIGISKGKGFQGVVKRHGFHGQDKTHGNKDQLRMPGSIGATGPARVFKGTRMGGHMGTDQVTLKKLEIIDIDLENNILYIKGGLPGARNSLVFISTEGELKKIESSVEVVEEVKVEKVESTSAEATEDKEIKPETQDKEAEKKEEVEVKEATKEVTEDKEKKEVKTEEK